MPTAKEPSRDQSDQAAARQVTAPLAAVTRRRFMKGVLLGSAGLAVAAGGTFAVLRRSPVDQQPVPEGIRHLSQSEYHLFRRAIDVLLPLAGSALTPVAEVPVLANIDAMIGTLPAHIRKDVASGLMLFDNAAVVSGWHGRRFVDLDDADAVAYFDRWSRGSVIQRTMNTVIKQFVYVSYWRDPKTWPPVEFDGPVSDRWGIAYLGNAPLPEEADA
ncbi:twin-arginine translocation signal domain-containing protein [Alcanivorax limicola]|uniref:twin-arginine translocation signal domain-containing protein n=1 Tax=Alcanivorax limicola TaxID=2874102 RepID=UPI001CBC4973|nr:twin-arginine translocation signal domain-containing protein [Alcanivorax limicola]